MQYVDNDMDDLFQRAAENYPLRIDEGDWESVAKRISVESAPEKTAVPFIKKINKRLILLALLLLTSICWLLFENIKVSKPTNGNNKILSNTISDNKNNQLVGNILSTNLKADNSQNKNDKQVVTDNSIIILPVFSSTATGKAIRKIYKSSYLLKANINAASVGESGNDIALGTENNSSDNKIEENNRKESKENFSNKIKEETKDQNKNITTNVKDESKKANDSSGKKNTKKGNIVFSSNTNKKGFYVGLVAAADFNKVEAGSFSHTGFDAGLLVGYRVNSRLSFETGVIRNNKNYVSQGKDFNMNKIRSSMPAGMVVDNLQSKSSLIEIPLKVKYDVIAKRKSNVFIGAGVSSYIMTKEKNNYDVSLNGVQSKFEKVYTKNSYDVPAVANLSIGYEQSISNYLHLRIEPFLKIPIQGVGVGSLPITSAGLQVGIISHLK